ncbi:MAG: hypothetical protein EOP22_02650 [Hyphomicrobiales bacterium]|nr:MAG: hypothetical protein EOP22_02650 [Hyphomicrobiales bacterium]
MNVIQFPSTPSKQAVAEVAARASAAHQRWQVECLVADDGQPYLALEHRSDGTILGAHWKAARWAVLSERGVTMSESEDLWTALEEALA